MNFCDCGTRIPEGFALCFYCESFADENPLAMEPEPLSADDIRLNGMDDEAADYADVFGTLEEAA